MFYLCESNSGSLTLFVEDDRGRVVWCHTYNDHQNPEHDCAVDIISCVFAEFDSDTGGNEVDSFIDTDMTPTDYAGDIVFSSAWKEYHNGIWYAFDNHNPCVAAHRVRDEIENILNRVYFNKVY